MPLPLSVSGGRLYARQRGVRVRAREIPVCSSEGRGARLEVERQLPLVTLSPDPDTKSRNLGHGCTVALTRFPSGWQSPRPASVGATE